jgi:hypothetical protein
MIRDEVFNRVNNILKNETEYELIEIYQKYNENRKRNDNRIKILHKKCNTITDTTLTAFYNGTRCQNLKCVLEHNLINITKKVNNILKNEPDYELIEIKSVEKKYNCGNKLVNMITILHKPCNTLTTLSTHHFYKGRRCNNKECIIKNREETCLKKYGKKNVMYDKNIKKVHHTKVLELTNSVEWIIKKDEGNRKRLYENYMTKYYPFYNQYNITPLFTEEEYIGQTNYYKFKCNKCGITFTDNFDNLFPRCPKCNNHHYTENEIKDYVLQLTKRDEYPKTTRFYDNNDNNKSYYELDIFLEEYNIGIEYDGLYWHSEISGDKDKKYHLNKTNFFEDKGIQILHIFENEWIHNKEIVKSMIASKLHKTNKIYARNCIIKEIPIEDCRNFQNKTHIQGFVGATIKLGLYYENELVSVLTLGKSRYNKNYEYEILRFSSKLFTTIIGGFSKLLKYFINNYNPSSIITYADRRYSNGNVYEKNGFTFLHNSDPNYFYNIGQKDLYSRVVFQKHKLKNKLEKFDENLTEWENMVNNGYDRIWDCGNKVYYWKKA